MGRLDEFGPQECQQGQDHEPQEIEEPTGLLPRQGLPTTRALRFSSHDGAMGGCRDDASGASGGWTKALGAEHVRKRQKILGLRVLLRRMPDSPAPEPTSGSPVRELIREEAKHLGKARSQQDGPAGHVGSGGATEHAQQQVRRAVTIQHYERILDATLRNVDLATLFPEILARVQNLLEADQVTVYLLDETNQSLHATASVGMEQAVEAGIRIPIGKGIAGSVLATGQSKALYEVNAETVANPLLVELGIQSLVAVPIIIDDLPVGVLTAGCISGRTYEPSEIRLLEVVAQRIGFAIERTRILRQVQIEHGRAERASRFKTTLMRMATHDIKTPLTTIKLQLALLNLPDATAEAKGKAVAVVNRSITRLQVILDDFLDLARIEAGRFTLTWQPVDLWAVADEVVQMFAPHAVLKKLELRLEGDSVQLEADERRLMQVLVNLVSNAIRYTQHGSILVRVGRKDNSAQDGLEAAELVVTDTGRGMEPDQIARLFQPFGQVHEGIQEGSGLGLYLSKVIVDAHGGTIRVESPGAGKGISVVIELPLHRPPETGSPVAVTSAPNPGSGESSPSA